MESDEQDDRTISFPSTSDKAAIRFYGDSSDHPKSFTRDLRGHLDNNMKLQMKKGYNNNSEITALKLHAQKWNFMRFILNEIKLCQRDGRYRTHGEIQNVKMDSDDYTSQESKRKWPESEEKPEEIFKRSKKLTRTPQKGRKRNDKIEKLINIMTESVLRTPFLYDKVRGEQLVSLSLHAERSPRFLIWELTLNTLRDFGAKQKLSLIQDT
ncbi:hypothetical protein ILUMI_25447 [Ignelater luminosus]|uniref:Uncharacterized protein n=1 Tax=Ignelater luminosus TaxID=2038154 RepID=A0A8K0C9Z8_IGNLU|nr:hypothetical protein ILUMI_25447 [Ignelater luminosus]